MCIHFKRPLSTFLNADGSLRIVEWAKPLFSNFTGHPHHPAQHLEVSTAPQPQRMAHSVATGRGLVSNGQLGVDLIRLGPREGFQPHTHPGDHLLIIVAGEGTITYDGRIYPTRAGQVYMVEGSVPHAVSAITSHVILAVGSPHKPIDALDRMTPTEYQSVVAKYGELTCLICKLTANIPDRLHDIGCQHCPCEVCVRTE